MSGLEKSVTTDKYVLSSTEGEKQTYTYAEALEASTQYFKGDEAAAKIWINKYALKDAPTRKGDDLTKIVLYEKTPDDMHRRLASEFERIEIKQGYKDAMSKEDIFELIKDFKHIVPQGSPMSGIGNNNQIVSLSNCFVVGEGYDSYGGIMNVDQEQVQLMKRRGGVGHDLSHIRPKKSKVENSALSSTGVVPFMERYSNSTKEVAQDGRRGALMLSLSVEHPDAEDFIDAKLESGKVTNANISIKVTDEFMRAVQEDKSFIQQYPIGSSNPDVTKEIDARGLWKKIVHNAWKSAEPGILFWDTVEREAIPDSYALAGRERREKLEKKYGGSLENISLEDENVLAIANNLERFKTVSTNPCGEIPLCPYDSCRLLAINLFSYVKDAFTNQAKFNWAKFKKHVGVAQRLNDDIIDLELEKIDAIDKKIENDPEPAHIKAPEKALWENIRRTAIDGRRTGTGITGEGDMLAAMGFIYGTKGATDFAVEVQKTIAIEGYKASVELAKTRGPFPIYNANDEKDNPFIQRIRKENPKLYRDMKKHGRRNISLLTIAPTGTTSMMTQTTSGIEPVFLPVYERKRKISQNDQEAHVDEVDDEGVSWEHFKVFHHNFGTWLNVNGYNVDEIKQLADDSVRDKEKEAELEAIIASSPYYKATSNDVDWHEKVRMQGAIQKWVDHSISVTINLPKKVKEELIGDLYIDAWKAGCKGLTVYRDGSRKGVLTSGKENNKPFPKKRPDSLDAQVLRFSLNDGENGGEEWISVMGILHGRPYEMFTGQSNEEMLAIPNAVKKGKITKEKNEDETSRYDFSFVDRNGYTTTIGGISHQFKEDKWNYSKMISGMLRNEIPILEIKSILSKLHEGGLEGFGTWLAGVNRTLNKYIPDGEETGETCGTCETNFRYEGGCKTCDCGGTCE